MFRIPLSPLSDFSDPNIHGVIKKSRQISFIELTSGSRRSKQLQQGSIEEQKKYEQQNLGNAVLDSPIAASQLSRFEAGKIKDPSAAFLSDYAKKLDINYLFLILKFIEGKYAGDEGASKWSNIDRELFGSFYELMCIASNDFEGSDISDKTKEKLKIHSIKAKSAWLSRAKVLDMEGLSLYETELRGENNFWIISHNVIEPISDLFRSTLIKQVVNNNSRYTFFLPEKVAKAEFKDMLRSIQPEIGDRINNVKVVPLDEAEFIRKWVDDDALFCVNPTDLKHQEIFRCVSQDRNARKINETYAIASESPRTLDILRSVRQKVDELFEDGSEMNEHITKP